MDIEKIYRDDFNEQMDRLVWTDLLARYAECPERVMLITRPEEEMIVKRCVALILQEHEVDLIVEALHHYCSGDKCPEANLAQSLIDGILAGIGKTVSGPGN